MPLDPRIFMQGAEMQQRGNQQLLQSVTGAIDMYQRGKQQQVQNEVQQNLLDIKRAESTGMDFTKLANQGMYKMVQGIQPSDDEMAAVKMMDAKSLTKAPAINTITGEAIPRVSLFDVLGRGGGFGQQGGPLGQGAPLGAVGQAPGGAPGIPGGQPGISVDLGLTPKTVQKAQEKAAVLQEVRKDELKKAKTPEAAGKESLLKNAQASLIEARKILAPKGVFDISAILAAQTNFPGTEGRRARNAITNAIEAQLRSESGAAVPETEVERATSRFLPSVLDNDATKKQKLDSLQRLIDGTLVLINPETARDLKTGQTIRLDDIGDKPSGQGGAGGQGGGIKFLGFE